MTSFDLQRYPNKLCLLKYELSINVYNSENWLFSIARVLYKYYLRISAAVRQIGIIRIKHF